MMSRSTLNDVGAWPIPGIVCFYGPGFSANMRAFLTASGKAVELQDLETWLRLYFVLPAPRGGFAVPADLPREVEVEEEAEEPE